MSAAMPSLIGFARQFAPQLARQRPLIAGSFTALFAEVLFRLLEPWPLKFVIDSIVAVDGKPVPVHDALAALPVTTLLLLAAASVVLIAIFRAGAAYIATVGFAIVGNRVLIEVRNELFAHLQTLSLRFHGRSRTGDLITRITGDIGMLKDVAVTALLPLMGNLCVLLGMLIVMGWLNWRLTLIVLVVAPVVLMATNYKRRRIRDVARKQRRRESALATTAAESVTGIHTVQALSLGDRFRDEFLATASQDLKQSVKGKRLAAGLERTVDVTLAFATALVLWFGVRDVLAGILTAGELLVFLAYLKGAFKPVRNWAKFTARIAKASAAAERVTEVLDLQPEVREKPDARPLLTVTGAIRFEKVGFSYGDDTPALRDVDLTVAPGETIAIVGPSGAGKSTLLSLALRLYDPESGRVCVDDHDLRDLKLDSLRKCIAVVLQDNLLFAGTLGDNIARGAVTEVDARDIVLAAQTANIDDFICALPDGYETSVSERGVSLSAGQRQRVAVARAAIRNAPILLLDEPTANLDPANAAKVNRALAKLSDGRTTLYITHRLSDAAHADRIVVMQAGQIVETGSHAELMAAGGAYAAMCAQRNVDENDADRRSA